MSMKNSNDTIRNRSRDLPVCSAVPQPLRHRVPRIGSVVGRIFYDDLAKIWNSRHGLIRTLSQHMSVSTETSHDCRCSVDIRTARLSNRSAVQPYHYASLLVAKHCSDFRLPPRCSRGRRSFVLLSSVGCSVVTDVSWQPISPILKVSTSPRTWTATQIQRCL
jgi:hypothetical protein